MKHKTTIQDEYALISIHQLQMIEQVDFFLMTTGQWLNKIDHITPTPTYKSWRKT